MSKMGWFEEIDHTADQAIRITARTLSGLFKSAVQGMYSVMKISCEKEVAGTRMITLSAVDKESLLVEFLSMILNSVEVEEKVLEIRRILVSANKLSAMVWEHKVISLEKSIKAVTYHDLLIHKQGELWQTTVTFDV